MRTYRCTHCGRLLRRGQCVPWDDPMAPFGPELLCPRCRSLVVPRVPAGVVVTAVALAAAAVVLSRVLW